MDVKHDQPMSNGILEQVQMSFSINKGRGGGGGGGGECGGGGGRRGEGRRTELQTWQARQQIYHSVNIEPPKIC